MQKTMHTIVTAASLPLSIVIVGVGNANFDNMEILDGDNVRLKSPKTGELAVRDIVQFVPLNDFTNDFSQSEPNLEKHRFTQAVLHEIPDQVVSYGNVEVHKRFIHK